MLCNEHGLLASEPGLHSLLSMPPKIILKKIPSTTSSPCFPVLIMQDCGCFYQSLANWNASLKPFSRAFRVLFLFLQLFYSTEDIIPIAFEVLWIPTQVHFLPFQSSILLCSHFLNWLLPSALWQNGAIRPVTVSKFMQAVRVHSLQTSHLFFSNVFPAPGTPVESFSCHLSLVDRYLLFTLWLKCISKSINLNILSSVGLSLADILQLICSDGRLIILYLWCTGAPLFSLHEISFSCAERRFFSTIFHKP